MNKQVYEQKFKESYDLLNSKQKEAVDTIEGPVIVQAGPGTGKTQILALRIAQILRKQGSDMAENILALTFTNAGVSAMRERLASNIGSDAYRVGIFTFHSFAESIIKDYPDYFSDQIVSSAASDVERYSIVEQEIQNGEYEKLRPFAAPNFFVPKVLSAVDELKREGYTVEGFIEWNEELKNTILEDESSYYKISGKTYTKGDMKPNVLKPYEKNIELARAYAGYQSTLSAKKLYDFNDMILLVVAKMQDDEDFLSIVQEKYQYVLVDEHQDTNRSQSMIIKLLSSAEHLDGRPNLFTVGDDKQAIYRFQGASLDNFRQFESLYNDVKIISLDQNYRSGQQILDSSHSLISVNDKDRHIQLIAQNSKSDVVINEFPQYSQELNNIAESIKSQLDQGVDPTEVAVMYRQNSHVESIRKALARHAIPSIVMGKENVLKTNLVYKIILLLEVISSLTNNKKLAQLLYSNIYPTQAYDVVLVLNRFRKTKRTKNSGERHLFKVIQDPKILKDAGVQDVDVFLTIAQDLQLMSSHFAGGDFMTTFDFMTKHVGIIRSVLESSDSYSQLRYYDRFYTELKNLNNNSRRLDIVNVVQHIDTLQEYGLSLDSAGVMDDSSVRLLTAHKSKGLEYDYVYTTNLVSGVWGNKRNPRQFRLPDGASSGDDDDERRLLYVAITRAKKDCYISFSRTNEEGKTVDPSPFLYDLPADVASWNKHPEEPDLEYKYREFDERLNMKSIFDTKQIQDLYKIRKLSVTALNNYIDCPARYFFNNLLQVPASYTKSLSYGNLVHKTLELFFTKAKTDKEIPSEDYLLEVFTEQLDQEGLSDLDYQDLSKKGRESLSEYWREHHTQWSCEVENEMRINGVDLNIGSETVTLTGVLDKVEYLEENLLRVVDYKTGKTFSEKTKDQKHTLERQIVFYSLLLSLYRDGHYQMQEGVLEFIETNSKTSKYSPFSLVVDEEMRSSLVEQIAKMNQEISRGASFLDNRCQKKNCESCVLFELLQ